MSNYDGLNLPQLLARMHDVVVPEPIAWTPQTPGWLVVAATLLVAALIAAHAMLIRWRTNRYRREALARLKAIETDLLNAPSICAQEIGALLKRTALAAYPRVEVAQLHGVEWAHFLCRSCNDDPEVREAAERLAGAAYRLHADPTTLISPARRWIVEHRA